MKKSSPATYFPLSFAVITNCFNGNGTLSSENKLSSVFFINSYGTVASNYPEDTVTLTKEKMQGEDALTAEDKMPLLNTDSAFSATAAYPKLSVFEGKDGVSAAEQASIPCLSTAEAERKRIPIS